MTLKTVQQLADTGRHTAVVDYLTGLPDQEVAKSPTLALLFGSACARLGRDEQAQRWVAVALARARERGDRPVEARALNLCGAIAFDMGRIDDAAQHFTEGLAQAEREDDPATVGRCSNNLGIIASLRGDHGRAVGSYTMALAAFQQAGLHAGVAETLHNLAMTYRDQGDLEATEAGDLRLVAWTQGGRAEIRLLAGDPAVARREVEHAIAMHRDLGDIVGEAYDLRVLGCVLAELGDEAEAERTLRQVIERAEAFGRPLLAALAERDLAKLFLKVGREEKASDWARRARTRFIKLGAQAEVRSLD
ncbi:MAG: tetratricopeptide repeat protein [Gemmatimonadetes bacterium]|nr:tetratricopeptide repeat protein [Gemmatimonadota bacterium]